MNARAQDLRAGDLVICPKDGARERVTFKRTVTRTHVFVRTSRHDHNWRKTKSVELVTHETEGA